MVVELKTTQVHGALVGASEWECSQMREDGARRTRTGQTFEHAYVACLQAPWQIPRPPEGAA